MKQEELEARLSKCGIKGEWINPDKYGFSRTYAFTVLGQYIEIEWYCNYSTITIGNVEFWFNNIHLNSGYPECGEWIEFTYMGEHGLHLKVGE